MPRGVYARQQELTGYKDRAYWSRKQKEQAGFTCVRCGTPRPARLLVVRQVAGVGSDYGRVLCRQCDAASHFGEDVARIEGLLSKLNDFGLEVSRYHVRRWQRVGLVPKPKWGYLPESILPRLALLYHNRNLPEEKLRELANRQEVKTVVLQNSITGRPEVMHVIEEFPGVSLDGRVYHAQRLISGDILISGKTKSSSISLEVTEDGS